MEFFKKEPIVFLIAGKARSGKSTVGEIIRDKYINDGKRVIVSPVTKYLKKYIEEVFGDIVYEDNKPRELLQKISSQIIKDDLRMTDFFTRRLLEDLNIYSYFFDVIIVPDVRFKEEIDIIKKNFKYVVSIGVVRKNYESDLTVEEQNDITEISLDYYDDYDYKIINDVGVDLSVVVLEILRKIGDEVIL